MIKASDSLGHFSTYPVRSDFLRPFDSYRRGVLALGAESAGNFCVYFEGAVHHSDDFGDLYDEGNFSAFKKEVLRFLESKKIKPDIVVCDLHPDYRTTELAADLSRKHKAELMRVQHHVAHVFSVIGDCLIQDSRFRIQDSFFGIAMDGTGYGEDGMIWGGEVFEFSNFQFSISETQEEIAPMIRRVGSLENQLLIGGEMAVKEPARVLIAALSKCSIFNFQCSMKDGVYSFVDKYYTRNEFEVLWVQMESGFNCVETSSAGRVLDAVSVLLGLAGNERNYKHEASALLAENSTEPYLDLKPKILSVEDGSISNVQCSIFNDDRYILDTTYLFEYLVKNLHKDKRRLAATAQKYIADGMLEIVYRYQKEHAFFACHSWRADAREGNPCHSDNDTFLQTVDFPPAARRAGLPLRFAPAGNDNIDKFRGVYAAGGLTALPIVSETLEGGNVYLPKKIPRGDAGLSFGQLVFYLLGGG